MKPRKAVLTLGFFAFVLLLAAPAFLGPPQNPDLFWHLSAGKQIVLSRSIPRADFLSWSMSGQPWTDFEWLTQAVYFLLYSKYGLAGMQALKLFFFGGAAAFIFLLLRLYGIAACFPAVFPLWAAALLPCLDIRADNATLFFFTAELYVLERIRLKGTSAGELRLFLLSLPPFIIWTNLHAGVMYGIALAVIMAAGEALHAFFRPEERTARIKTAVAACTVAAAGAAGACVTPFGTAVYSIALTHQADMGVLQAQIKEWMPPAFSLYQLPYWFLLFGGMLAGLSMLRRKNREWFPVLAFVFFGIMSLQHVRHSIFSVTAAIALIAAAAAPYIEKYRKTAIAAGMAITVLSLVLINHLASAMKTAQPFVYVSGARGITAFLERNSGELGKLKMFNPWAWGGYLGWRLYPSYMIYQDGRYIFHRFLPENFNAQSSNDKWQVFLSAKSIDLALMDGESMLVEHKSAISLKKGSKQEISRPIYCYYMPKKDWALVFYGGEGDLGLLFARRATVSPQWLEENEIKILRPLDDQAVRLMLKEKLVSPGDIERDMAIMRRNSELSPSLSDVLDFWRQVTAPSPTSRPPAL